LVDHSSCLGKNINHQGLSVISVHDPAQDQAIGELRRFRQTFYECLTARADAVFDLVDAVLCADGPARSLAELSLVGEHRRGHGSAYAAVAQGRIDIQRLRVALAGVPLPRAADGRLMLAVDITCWLRPEAHTSPQRVMCHTYGRGKDQAIMIPGWPYSVIVGWEPGRSSWTAPLDVQRLAPGDAATVTATQVRQLIGRLIQAGQWVVGDPESSSWSMPATTGPGWPGSCAICRCRCWLACALTGCCVVNHRPGSRGHTVAANPATATNSSSPTRTAGMNQTPPRRPKLASTAWPTSKPGTGCTRGSPAVRLGSGPATCRSSPAQ
jgi:hypothetical protein